MGSSHPEPQLLVPAANHSVRALSFWRREGKGRAVFFLLGDGLEFDRRVRVRSCGDEVVSREWDVSFPCQLHVMLVSTIGKSLGMGN